MTPGIKSMTGFGRGSARSTECQATVSVELQAVNRKNLDIQISSPREWTEADVFIQEELAKAFTRGRINAQVKIDLTNVGSSGLQVDPAAIDSAISSLRALAERTGIEFAPDTKLLYELTKSVESHQEIPPCSKMMPQAKEAFALALAELELMRSTEGASLKDNICQRLNRIRALTQQIASESSELVVNYRDRLLERLKKYDLELDLADDRVLKELAIFADKSDISEEITRLEAHLEQFDTFLSSNRPSGRKMDFLCQEIHRELNTTGSKSSEVSITRSVIEGKNELERIREQIQNIE